jgi:hypothetical protein
MTESKTAAKPTLDQIIQKLDLKLITQPRNFAGLVPTAGYTSDLLSCVMASNVHQGIWITLQAHTNIVAVAALLDMGAVIITEGAMPDPVTVNKANEEGVILLSTTKPSFEVVGQLWELGLRAR